MHNYPKILGPIISNILLGAIFVIIGSGLQIPSIVLAQILSKMIVPPLQSHILWSADHETGDFSQWTGNSAGVISISGTADARISTKYAHSGLYSSALTIYNANGTASVTPGVRLVRVGTAADLDTLPTEAYYSTWYYFPQKIEPAVFWNIFQWKRKFVRNDGTTSSDPVYVVDIGNRNNGAMYFYLYSHVGHDGKYNTPGIGLKATSPLNIPLDSWVHFECYYRWSTKNTGRVACWQNGQQIMDTQNVITEFDYGDVYRPRQWTINNYSNQTNPSTQTIYIDDAVISTKRIGPDGTTEKSKIYLPVIVKRR